MELEGSLLSSQAPATHPILSQISHVHVPSPTSWREDNLRGLKIETVLCAALGTASCSRVYRYSLHVVGLEVCWKMTKLYQNICIKSTSKNV